MTKRCTNFPTVEIEVAESSYEKSQVGNTDHEAAAEALRHESRSQKTEIISNPQISATGGGGSSRDVGSWGDRLRRLKRMLPGKPTVPCASGRIRNKHNHAYERACYDV